MSAVPSKSDKCLNCGHHLSDEDNFCPNCGQENIRVIVPLGQFLHDFFQDYIAFDKRFFSSILPLLFAPGRLSDEYCKGKRAAYIAPVRMYLFTSLVFFFALALIGKRESALVLKNHPDSFNFNLQSTLDSLNQSGAIKEPTDTTYYHVFRNSILGSKSVSPAMKMQYFTNKLIHNIPIMMFILLPLFALWIMLFFKKKRKYYIEHLIFTVHYHTFLYLAFLLLTLLGFVFPFISFEWYVWTSFLYLFFGIFRFYHTKLITAFFKSLGIWIGYTLMLTMGVLFTVILSLIIQ